MPTLEQPELIRKLASARPFLKQVVQSPWDGVHDTESIHREARERVRQLLIECLQPAAIRGLTVVAPPGYGKTHLLAWARWFLERQNAGALIYVTPYLFGSETSFASHVVRATVQALWLRARSQAERCDQGVRTALGDPELESRMPGRVRTLLEQALTDPAWIERAFATFTERHPLAADGVRPHRDTFVAAALMTAGDPESRWAGRRWLQGEAVTHSRYAFGAPPTTVDSARDALFTLNRLTGVPFLFAFDQLEDTAQSLPAAGPSGWAALSTLWRAMLALPRFASLYLFQQSVWQHFVREAPPMLVDRMTEGQGVLTLSPLDDDAAAALLRGRLRAAWSAIGQAPPGDTPDFPFEAGTARHLRRVAGGEMRGLLRGAHAALERMAYGEAPATAPTLRLISIAPSGAFSHEEQRVTIRGENLPAKVDVRFDDQPAQAVVLKASEGIIEATAPTGIRGDASVSVNEADQPNNVGYLKFRFGEEQVARPYGKYIDRKLMKDRREELGLSVDAVASLVGFSTSTIRRMESGETECPSDQLFERLAQAYGRPLHDFRKRQRDGKS